MKHLPNEISVLTQRFGGLIVGSAAHPKVYIQTCRDFDIVFPYDRWENAAAYLADIDKVKIEPNRFGGWKVLTKELVEMDCWPGNIHEMMERGVFQYFWSPHYNLRYKLEKQ